MHKFVDSIWAIFLILFLGGIGPFIIYANNSRNEECIQQGGQIIRHNTKIGDSCILPVGKK